MGGKKTCLHNIPTVQVQKLLLPTPEPTPTKPRTSKCLNRTNPNEDRPIINEQLVSAWNQISELEHVVEAPEQKNQEYEEEFSKLKEKVHQCNFSIDQFKSNDSEFDSSTPVFPIIVHLELSITICVQHVIGYSIFIR